MAGLRVEGLYKVFGEEPERAFPLLEEGKGKDEVKDQTGLVVGVQDVSFELTAGIFVIMGLSGSGKSTLLRCINRLVEPTRGRVFVQAGEEEEGSEVEITALAKKELREVRKRHIGMVFQHFALFPYRTVLDNVAFGLEIQGVDRAQRHQKARDVLEMVGLAQWAEVRPGELSGGMQQRVGLCRALAAEADVLLMDEPFSALDPLIRVHMHDELLKLQEQIERPILFISHDLDEALKLGDRIAIMEEGRIVQMGSPEDIMVNPSNEYVSDFVENADATGVLSSATIARPLEPTSEAPGGLEADHQSYARAEGLVFGLDGRGRLQAVYRDGRELEVAEIPEDPADTAGRDAVFTAGGETHLRRVMQARLHNADHPLAILDEDRRLVGIVAEREILEGTLEKGREGGGEEAL
jgi:glycine betaine/proline transport system ATP-binding protein